MLLEAHKSELEPDKIIKEVDNHFYRYNKEVDRLKNGALWKLLSQILSDNVAGDEALDRCHIIATSYCIAKDHVPVLKDVLIVIVALFSKYSEYEYLSGGPGQLHALLGAVKFSVVAIPSEALNEATLKDVDPRASVSSLSRPRSRCKGITRVETQSCE